MKAQFVKIFLFVIILTGAAGTVTAQQTTSFLSGKVKDEQNMPLQGVSVEITYLPWNKTKSVTTNKKGVFCVPNLHPGGPYTIKFTCNGYEAQTRELLSLDLGNVNDLSLHMRLESKEANNKEDKDNLVVSYIGNAAKNSDL